jgi:hypothetical protein
MDRKNALKDLSAADLRQELINRLREQIRRNELENESLREQIRQLNPQAIGISVKHAGRPRPTEAVRNGQPLREIICEVLKESHEPLRVRDVVERVRKAGYVSKAGNFNAIVSISLSQNQQLFEKVSRGLYRLRDGANMDVASGAEESMEAGAEAEAELVGAAAE